MTQEDFFSCVRPMATTVVVSLSLILAPVTVRAADWHDFLGRLNLDSDTIETCVFTAGGEPSEPLSMVSRCVADRAFAGLLAEGLQHLEDQGQKIFGMHFHIENRLSFSRTGSGLRGDLDAVFPLEGIFTTSDVQPARAFFLQTGMTRWTDKHGLQRDDLRHGLVHRFPFPGRPVAGNLGVSAFFQKNIQRGHQRIVGGLDYAGKWGRGSLQYFAPTTDWRPGVPGYEERAIEGMELDLRFDATDTIVLDAEVGRWEATDGSDGWTTQKSLGVGWQPHPWFRVGVDWDQVDTAYEAIRIGAVISVPFGGPEQRRPRWKGLGSSGVRLASFSSNIWDAVDNVGRIELVERKLVDEPGGLARPQLRFLQSSARSGSEFNLEVTLPNPVSAATTVTVRLVPGNGDTPAVPGVDYDDKPIDVTIPRGGTSGTATVQLLRNPGLTTPRALSARIVESGKGWEVGENRTRVHDDIAGLTACNDNCGDAP